MEVLGFLQQNSIVFYIVIFILGLLVGSFLNVVIYRLPLMMKHSWRSECIEYLSSDSATANSKTADLETTDLETSGSETSGSETSSSEKSQPETADTSETFNLSTPRSRCPECGHLISAVENIPLLSYIFLKGKCRQCKTSISLRYPFIELLSALVATFVAYQYGVSLQTLCIIPLGWALIALTFIDFDHQYLPDNITLPFLWLGLLVNYFGIITDLESAVIGAMLGYAVLWTMFHLFRLLTGKEGMGYGDFKLLGMLGAWLGWQMLPTIIILSSLVGSIVGITLIVLKKQQRSKPIPFGPYLAAAGCISLIWGNEINTAYLNWIAQ